MLISEQSISSLVLDEFTRSFTKFTKFIQSFTHSINRSIDRTNTIGDGFTYLLLIMLLMSMIRSIGRSSFACHVMSCHLPHIVIYSIHFSFCSFFFRVRIFCGSNVCHELRPTGEALQPLLLAVRSAFDDKVGR